MFAVESSVPLVSVLIVNWNGAQYLPACIHALSRQTFPAIELILVDNASTDGSGQVIDECRQRFPALQFSVIKNTRNEGFCRGNNQGIHASRGEYVLLLNADVTLEPDYITRLIEGMQTAPNAGIAIGKLLSGHDPRRIDSAGVIMSKQRRAFDRGQGDVDAGQYDRMEEVFGACGAASLYRRAMLEEIKYSTQSPQTAGTDEYLDELFFAYKEDVDIAWRARLRGWICLYIPRAQGYHFRNWGTGKRRDIPKWVRRHSLKNRYLMLLKNERWETLRPFWWLLAWFECQSLCYILFREPHLLTVIHAIAASWPEIMRKRRITQANLDPRQFASTMMAWFQ